MASAVDRVESGRVDGVEDELGVAPALEGGERAHRHRRETCVSHRRDPQVGEAPDQERPGAGSGRGIDQAIDEQRRPALVAEPARGEEHQPAAHDTADDPRGEITEGDQGHQPREHGDQPRAEGGAEGHAPGEHREVDAPRPGARKGSEAADHRGGDEGPLRHRRYSAWAARASRRVRTSVETASSSMAASTTPSRARATSTRITSEWA